MRKQSWLISWVGKADHDCAEGERGDDLGPVASAIKAHSPFDKIHLLTNYDFERTKAYCAWLEKTINCVEPEPYSIDLSSPTQYAEIYEKVSKALKVFCLPNDSIEVTFHLSPGTPAMTAIWIILAKTRFPAKLIQTSKENGLESVDFFFDLASEYLPEFLKRSSDRIERLSDEPPGPSHSDIIEAGFPGC